MAVDFLEILPVQSLAERGSCIAMAEDRKSGKQTKAGPAYQIDEIRLD